MLLRQLVEFVPTVPGEGEDARAYSRQRLVRWELNLDAAGQPRGLVELTDPDSPNRVGRQRLVPNAGRTVGIAPCLGVDDIQYVLGWADDKAKPGRVADAHAAFVALTRRWATEHPDDHVAQALTAFYDSRGPDAVTRPDKWSSKDLVLVAVAGVPATDSATLWRLWAAVVEARKSGSTQGGIGRRGLCLVCGRIGVLLDRMPQALPKALIPRAEQEVALVSANRTIHTYEFSEGLGTAPICVDCGRAAVQNMHTILSDSWHTFSFPKQRTRLAWWVTAGGDSATIALLNARPSVIADYLAGVLHGTPRRRPDDHRLCSVTVSGNIARLVVHDWVDLPLPDAEANVAAWFRDHQICHRWRDEHQGYPIWRLVSCAGQWQPGARGSSGKYIPLNDKAADRPDDLAQLLVHSALHGTRLPPYVLAHLVRRIRTDQHIDEPRAALLRVALTRHPTRAVEAPLPGLDPTNTSPAYLLGRLFAVLEATQRAAYPGDNLPNTTFFDRYFAGAIANPRVAFVQGSQMWPAWLKKIRTSADREARKADRDRRLAAAFALKNRISELTEQLAVQPLPALTTSAHQSLFIIGYHHQRAHDLARARAGKAPEITLEQPQPDDTAEPAA